MSYKSQYKNYFVGGSNCTYDIKIELVVLLQIRNHNDKKWLKCDQREIQTVKPNLVDTTQIK